MSDTPQHNRQRDVRHLAKLLRDGGYTYDQSAHLFKLAREQVGLTPPKRSRRGSVDRLSSDELELFLLTAYSRRGRRGLMMRTLFETGTRVGTFVRIDASGVSFADLESRVLGKGSKHRDVPILQSLANELRLHRADRASLSRDVRGEGHHRENRAGRLPSPAALYRPLARYGSALSASGRFRAARRYAGR